MVQENYIIDYNAAEIPVSVKRLRPAIVQDGKAWSVFYCGNDGKTAISGAGKTPVEAMANFDRDYQEKKHKAVETWQTH